MVQLIVVVERAVAVLALVAVLVTDAVGCSCKALPIQERCNDTFGEACDVFRRGGNDGTCHSLITSSDPSQLSNFSGEVIIFEANLNYAEGCETEEGCTVDPNEMGDCRSLGGWTHISLDIIYGIVPSTAGDGFQGVLFNLTPDSEQELVSLRKPCHYICLENPIGPGKFKDERFHYRGYLGLHPGATYNLTATPLYSANPSTSSKVVEVQNCRYDGLENRDGVCDYYCNLRTPANNRVPSRLMGVHQNLTSWFTVHPWEGSTVTSFNFSLKPAGRNSYTESVSIGNIRENYRKCTAKRQNCLEHTFTGSGSGTYRVKVFAQPDTVCLNDVHWQQKCGVTITSVTVLPAETTTPGVTLHSNPSIAEPVAKETSSGKIDDLNMEVLLLLSIVGSILVLVSFVVFQLVKRVSCRGISNSWLGSDSLTRVDSADEIACYVPRPLEPGAYPGSFFDPPVTVPLDPRAHPATTPNQPVYPTRLLKPTAKPSIQLDSLADSSSPLNPEENHPT